MKAEITRGVPYPLGISREKDGVNIAYESTSADCGVVFFTLTGKEKKRIAFLPEYTVGNVHCMHVNDNLFANTVYCFYDGERLVADERGRRFWGHHVFGVKEKKTELPRLACLPSADYDWGKDQNPRIPYEQCVGYCMHVRGFTRHVSSGVKARGTFLGLTEKIPYLKELGITTLELQPIYEFEELEKIREEEQPFAKDEEVHDKLNYWGYTKGCYYSPKNAYAYAKDAVTECKDMIKELHQNGIEIVLQFYFTEQTAITEISAILRYWVTEYHVDGFHLKGKNIKPELLLEEPVLAKSKLWYYGFPIKQEQGERYLAEYRDDFRYDMRRFLKGDEGMLPAVMYHLHRNPAGVGQINYLTNYDGFTLRDLVSYDRKHNEANGEDNKDGNDSNASWNCGQEGPSRKKNILHLRKRQMKNALMLLFLSQGTPILFMGDEFGNSQSGNNNPYCQDNGITWLNWNDRKKNKELYDFTKGLIALRMAHPVLHQEKELRMMDYGSCGYPDASYHGEAPWKPNTEVYSRQLGVMYCGKYAYKDSNTSDDFFYVAYNMHWESHIFSLPKLPKGIHWHMVVSPQEEIPDIEEQDQPAVLVPSRCICLFIGKQDEVKKKGRVSDEGMETFQNDHLS